MYKVIMHIAKRMLFNVSKMWSKHLTTTWINGEWLTNYQSGRDVQLVDILLSSYITAVITAVKWTQKLHHSNKVFNFQDVAFAWSYGMIRHEWWLGNTTTLRSYNTQPNSTKQPICLYHASYMESTLEIHIQSRTFCTQCCSCFSSLLLRSLLA